MSKQRPRIIWDEVALTELEEIGEYLEKEVQSLQAARKVVKTIKDTIATLPYNPEIFSIDPFIKDKSLQIRFFEKFSYRILYRYVNNEVHILTIRHSSRTPLEEL